MSNSDDNFILDLELCSAEADTTVIGDCYIEGFSNFDKENPYCAEFFKDRK